MPLPNMRPGVIGREFLRIAGGYGVGEVGKSPAGGLDIDNAGHVATDGDVTVRGVISAGDTPQAITNANGEIDGARIQSASVDTGQLADDAVTPAKLDETGDYNVNSMTTTSGVTVGGDVDVQGGDVKNTTGNLALDAQNDAADSTVYVKNSDVTYKADLDVEGDLRVNGNIIKDSGGNAAITFDGDGELELRDMLTVSRTSASGYQLELDSSGASSYALRLRHPEVNKKVLAIENLHDSGGSPNFSSDILFRVGAASSPLTAMKIEEDGDVWVYGDCSALSFTDRSPIFTGNALAVIKSIFAKAGTDKGNGWAEVDHDSLPDGVKVVRNVKKYRDRQSGVEHDLEYVTKQAQGKLTLIERRTGEGENETVEFVYVDNETEYASDGDWIAQKYETVTRQETRRDIGAQIQFNLRAITQLLDKIGDLEARVVALEGAG